MPDTISVSPTAPEKLVVNGVDLLNRDELSVSQNRELQRYIDAHAHLLGFLDKEKEGNIGEDEKGPRAFGGYGTTGSLERIRKPLSVKVGDDGELASKKLEHALLQRSGSTASTDSKRKGVSWSDATGSSRPRAESPLKYANGFKNPNQQQPQYGSTAQAQPAPVRSQFAQDDHLYQQPRQTSPWGQSNLQPRSGDRYRAGSHEPSPVSRPPASWGNHWLGGSRENLMEKGGDGLGYRGFPKQVVPTYTALDRDPDDYNKYDTHRFREHQDRRSRERDDTIRFHGYGDHRVSGVCEPKPVYWQGGEIVTDPYYHRKLIKPRSMFYSPIGDGVVAADGVELKRLPPDLNPKVDVIHQRIVEPGDPGHKGVRVTEKLWDEGTGRKVGDDEIRERYIPWGDDDGGKRGDGGPPFPSSAADKNKFPVDNLGDLGDGLKNGTGLPAPKFVAPDEGKFSPVDSGFGDRGSVRPDSALSTGTPREGWTKTFIINPRECINIYGTEVLTSIFDLEDHTPKTMVTVKETISPARDIDLKEAEEA